MDYVLANCSTDCTPVLSASPLLVFPVVVHERLLVSLYRGLCGTSECPPVFGGHWESIGFQGKDPSTDVRGGGVFGLVQLLHFVQSQQELAMRIFTLSNDPVQHFPFSVVGLNLSGFVLTALRSGLLNGECNREGDVWRCCHRLFAAAMGQLFTEWKDTSATITSWSCVRRSGPHHSTTALHHVLSVAYQPRWHH